MYYVMETQHHELVSMISYPGIGWGLAFTEGKYLEPNFGNGEILIEFESDHASLPDYFEVDGTPIVSEKFAQVWQSLTIANCQFFPITAKFPSRLLQGHQVLNIIGRVACIHDASECNRYEGRIVRIKKLVLRDNLDPAVEVFRAQEHQLTILISNRIKDALQSSLLSGIRITPAANWNDGHRF